MDDEILMVVMDKLFMYIYIYIYLFQNLEYEFVVWELFYVCVYVVS